MNILVLKLPCKALSCWAGAILVCDLSLTSTLAILLSAGVGGDNEIRFKSCLLPHQFIAEAFNYQCAELEGSGCGSSSHEGSGLGSSNCEPIAEILSR